MYRRCIKRTTAAYHLPICINLVFSVAVGVSRIVHLECVAISRPKTGTHFADGLEVTAMKHFDLLAIREVPRNLTGVPVRCNLYTEVNIVLFANWSGNERKNLWYGLSKVGNNLFRIIDLEDVVVVVITNAQAFMLDRGVIR